MSDVLSVEKVAQYRERGDEQRSEGRTVWDFLGGLVVELSDSHEALRAEREEAVRMLRAHDKYTRGKPVSRGELDAMVVDTVAFLARLDGEAT